MQRQSIIVFIQGDRVETYGNLKKCLESEGFKDKLREIKKTGGIGSKIDV